MLIDEIARELNAEILIDNKKNIRNSEELLGIIKCLGYEVSQSIVDPHTFIPRKYFVSSTYNEMINERNNNTFWQDWVRAREQDKKT